MFDDAAGLTLSHARQLMVAHRSEEAFRLVSHLTVREPDNVEAWLFLAFYYMDFDYRRALDAWKQIARLRPDDATARDAIDSLSSFLA